MINLKIYFTHHPQADRHVLAHVRQKKQLKEKLIIYGQKNKELHETSYTERSSECNKRS